MYKVIVVSLILALSSCAPIQSSSSNQYQDRYRRQPHTGQHNCIDRTSFNRDFGMNVGRIIESANHGMDIYSQIGSVVGGLLDVANPDNQYCDDQYYDMRGEREREILRDKEIYLRHKYNDRRYQYPEDTYRNEDYDDSYDFPNSDAEF